MTGARGAAVGGGGDWHSNALSLAGGQPAKAEAIVRRRGNRAPECARQGVSGREVRSSASAGARGSRAEVMQSKQERERPPGGGGAAARTADASAADGSRRETALLPTSALAALSPPPPPLRGPLSPERSSREREGAGAGKGLKGNGEGGEKLRAGAGGGVCLACRRAGNAGKQGKGRSNAERMQRRTWAYPGAGARFARPDRGLWHPSRPREQPKKTAWITIHRFNCSA